MKFILFLAAFLLGHSLFATAQVPDLLIFQGDTLLLHSNPLEAYFDQKEERTIGSVKIQGACTALWRGYIATWEIVNDSLFLIDVKTGCWGADSSSVKLKEEFGPGKIFAHWVSYELNSPYGKQIKYFHQGYDSIYEFERGFLISKGKLTSIIEYDNTQSSVSEYANDPEKLHQFFFNKINWKLVASQDTFPINRVIIRFHPDEQGRPTAIEVMRGLNPILDQEAIRVLSLLPQWNTYFKKGKLIEMKWNLPMWFDKKWYKKKWNLEK